MVSGVQAYWYELRKISEGAHHVSVYRPRKDLKTVILRFVQNDNEKCFLGSL